VRKNIASQHVAFQMISTTDGSDVTTGTPAVYYTIDGGTQATGTGAKVHEGNGQWSYVLGAAGESNGTHVAFTMVLTGAISQTVNVYPVSYDPTNATTLGLTNLDAAITSRLAPTTAGRTLGIDTSNRAFADVERWGNSNIATPAIAGVPDINVIRVGGTTTNVSAMATNANAILNSLQAATGTADSGTTLTMVDEARDEADTDYWVGSLIYFTSGNIAGQTRLITAFTAGSPATITFTPATTLPVVTNTYEIRPAAAGVTAGDISSGVWDLTTVGHITAGTFGAQLKTVLDSRMAEASINTTAGTVDTVATNTDMRGTDSAGVLTQVNAAIDTAIPELSVGAPVTTPTIRTGIMLGYMKLVNQFVVQTSTGSEAIEIYNAAGTKIASKLINDDGADFTEAKAV